MAVRPVVVQHCYGRLGLGGPIGGLARLLRSELADKYHFETCLQTRPAGGLNLSLIRELADQIRSFRPDLLHVRGLGNEGFSGLLAGRMARCPRILVSVHGLVRDTMTWSGYVRYAKQWIVGRVLEPYTLSHADGVYCVCEYAQRRKEITRHARRLFGYIHNAVELPPPTSPNPALRASFGFSAADVVAVYVGRLNKEKGLLDLLSAIRLLTERGENRPKMLIVGDGPDRRQFEAVAASLPKGRIVFAGQRNDVFDILRASDFLVLSSHRENLPNVLLEAMACERAIVATRAGGNPEVVVPGETGILVPPRDPLALANAMQSLAHNPEQCKTFGKAGRQRAENCFSMRCLTTKLDAVYQELLHS